MKIDRIQGISLIDYPDKIASVLFCKGCNMVCPYCQNPDLVKEVGESMEEREVIEILSERRGFIDGVVITGGEPTIQKDLSDFAKRIKELGLLVKIDTNGLLPDVLTELTSAGAVDYIALDIKASLTNYDRACGRKIETKKIKESIDLLLSSDIDYEFRTTCVPSLVNGEEISAICELIRGAKRYSLQQFQNKRTLNPEFGKVEPYSYEEIKRLAEIAEGYVQSVDLRGL